MKFLRALLGTAVAAAAALTVHAAVPPDAATQDTAMCLNCWLIIER